MFAIISTLILFLICGNIEAQEKFTIFQFNDIAGQFESFKEGTDPPEVLPTDDSVGGLAKLIGELNYQEEQVGGNTVLRISTGNLIGGFNGWIGVLGFEPFANAVKNNYSQFAQPSSKKIFLQGYGMKEFEYGLNQASNYINLCDLVNKPIISNFDCSEGDLDAADQEFCGYTDEKHYWKYKIIDVGSTKVGIVGFVNPLSMNLSDPGNLHVKNPAEAIKEVILNEAFNDIKTVLAIGGGSYTIAKEILDGVDKVKLVLYAGGSGHRAYPEEYNGKYIASSSQLNYGAKIGKMTFSMMTNGHLTLEEEAQLIPVKDRRDESVHKIVEDLKMSDAMVAAREPVGRTLVRLEGTREACWRAECNLGNLVADSLVHCALNKLDGAEGVSAEDLSDLVGVWNGGALFNDVVEPFNTITGMDIHIWLPYHNNAYLVILKGRDLKALFDGAGKGIIAPHDDSIEDWGRFMQVSDGLEVHYTENGDLVSLRIWHREDQIPMLLEVQDEKDYHLVLPSIIYQGRNSYGFLKETFQTFPNGATFKYIDFDDNCLRAYVEAMGVIKTGIHERIFIGKDDDGCSDCSTSTALTVGVTVVIFTLILVIAFAIWKFVWPMIVSRRRSSSFP